MRYRNYFLAISLFLIPLVIVLATLLSRPNTSFATHTAPGAWVEDPGITGCNHCHNTTITAGNANGSNRKIAHSPSQGSSQTGARRNSWASTVSYMIGKGCPATSAATAYLNACYCTTCSNPYPEGTSCLYVVDTEPPTTPTNVVGTPDPSGTKIALTWTASTDNVGVTGYNIYRDYGLTPVGSSATTSYTDTGLTPETTYTYEIEAYDAAGNKSPKSSPLQVTTAALPGDSVSPAPPQNLTAVSDISGTKVFIAWDPATDNMGIASYNIYRDGGSTAIGSSSTLTFLDTGLTPATTYSYEIESVDLSGNVSVRSSPVVVTTNFGSLLTNATVVCTMPEPGITNFVITPAFTDSGGGSIYVATGDNAIYRCTKSGGTWTRSGNLWAYSGFPYDDNPVYDVRMLAIAPNFSSNQTLFAATGGGFYKSVNAGTSWGINNTMMYGFNLTSLGVSPGFATDNTIYAGNWKDFPGQGGGLQTWDPMLYKSTVGGGSWATKKTLVGAGEGTGFTAVAVSSNGHVYAGVTETGTTFRGVWRSTNGGTTWTLVESTLNVTDIAISPDYATDCTVFATGDTQEIYRSVDCGTNWTPLAANDNPGFSIDAIDLSPAFGTDGDALFCSSGAGSNKFGLKRSGNSGTSWTDAAFQAAGCADVRYSPDFSASGIVFAATDTQIIQLETTDYTDADGDGWDVIADCDDAGNTIYPGATETSNDGIDQDCSGRDLAMEVRVDQAVSADQRFPWADYNETTGEYLAVWQDKRVGNDDIYASRLDQNGNKIGSDIVVSNAAGHQQRSFVKAGGGGYLAVWHDLRNQATNGADIYGAWINGNGTVGAQMAICACSGDQWNPVAGYDPLSNTFLVIFLDARGSSNNQTGNVNDNFDLYAAVIPAGGSGSVTAFPLVAANNGQRGPQIGYDYANGRYYVAWNDRRGGLSVGYDIYGSRVTPSGSVMDGTGVLVSGAAGNQFRPTVTDRRPAAAINDHIVAWTDYRGGSTADIYGVYIDGSGTIVGSEVAVSTNAAEQANVVGDVDWIRTKKALIGYITQHPASHYEIQGALVDQVGGVTGDYTIVGEATGASDEQRAESVTYATDGVSDYGFLVVWSDRRSGTDYDVYAIKVWP